MAKKAFLQILVEDAKIHLSKTTITTHTVRLHLYYPTYEYKKTQNA